MKLNFIYLNEKQMIEAGVADMKRCNDAIEYMYKLQKEGDFREGGDENDAHGLRLMFPKESSIPNMPLHTPGRWFTAMPAYLGGRYHSVGIKCYGANQENNKIGIPRSVLMFSLLDADTGMPKAYMSANILSAARTGAVSGLYAKYMAPVGAKRIAVIGPGVMARYSLDSIMTVCPKLKEIFVLGRGRANLDIFKKHCQDKQYSFDIYKECSSIEEVCNDADIILTTNSQSKFEDYPYIQQSYIKRNALIINATILRFDRAMFFDESVKFVTDDKRMYGKINAVDSQSKDINEQSVTNFTGLFLRLKNGMEVTDMMDIVCDPDFIRDPNKLYYCNSAGMPIEDVAWGCECYQQAKSKGLGTLLNLWDESAM